jgi:hypothetical protein
VPILESRTEIAESTAAGGLLGMRLEPGTTLGDVLAGWRGDHRAGEEPRWFSALAEQIEAAIVSRLHP